MPSDTSVQAPMSPEQIHRMSSMARLSAGMVALMLKDVDGPSDLKEDALAWASEAEDAAMSSTVCCEALANLNAYLNHYGLDAKPIERDGDYRIGADDVTLTASSPLAAVEADSWFHSIQEWCSSDYTEPERSAIGVQLVNIVDQQVQTCYRHLREQSQSLEKGHDAEFHGQSRGDYEMDDSLEEAILLDDNSPGSMNGPG